MTKLSIIIPSWNTASATCQCLRSIVNHLKNITYEIIVVDNASTDDTVLKIKKLAIKNLKLIINSQNLGFSKANNIGFQHSLGDYLLFLNSDMKLIDHSLPKMLDFLVSHPQIGTVGPQLLNPDHTPQGSIFPPQTLLNAFKEFWLGLPSYSKYFSSSPGPVWALSGGAILISRQLFQQINGWDEKYFIYFEDLELCRQIKKLGYQIFYFPQTKIIHRHGLSGRHLAPAAIQWRRLITSSLKFHGPFKHYLLNLIIWSGQKCRSVFS